MKSETVTGGEFLTFVVRASKRTDKGRKNATRKKARQGGQMKRKTREKH